MCGRYYIEIDDRELSDICNAVQQRQVEQNEQLEIKLNGEIFPANIVPIQTGRDLYQPMKWGFAGFDGGLLINARSETALTKTTFRESMLNRRCLIPASGYYEWLKDGSRKTKYRFYVPDRPLYLAGCYRQEKDMPVCSFVILTREASGGAETIHSRMPVIIPRDKIGRWFSSEIDIEGLHDEKLLFEVAG